MRIQGILVSSASLRAVLLGHGIISIDSRSKLRNALESDGGRAFYLQGTRAGRELFLPDLILPKQSLGDPPARFSQVVTLHIKLNGPFRFSFFLSLLFFSLLAPHPSPTCTPNFGGQTDSCRHPIRSDVDAQTRAERVTRQAPLRGRLPLRVSSPGVSKLTKMQSKWHPEPVNFLEGSAVDPFNTIVHPMTAEADVLLKYYSAFVSTGHTPYKLQHLPGKFRGLMPIPSVIDDHMSSAIRYEHCLYALFAFTSVRLSHVMKVRLRGIKSPHFYMVQAVSTLRRRLEEIQKSDAPIDRATIGAIAQLALADWTSGDLAKARIHINTLANLLGYVDIGDVRGCFKIETTRTADFQMALEDGTVPLLSAQPSFEPMPVERIRWLEDQVSQAAADEKLESKDVASRLGREPTLPSEILDDGHLTLDYRMGWALEEMLETDVVDHGLHPIIRSMLDVTTIGKAVWRLGVASVADARYMCRWGRTQLHCLHTYGFDHAGDDPTPQKSSDKLCSACFADSRDTLYQ